ncbi:glycosyl transferase family protein [Meridianimarinicoccus roseus]|uniref:Glycosyl transferase family protein n=1 Tax=Meridianimarinicoccus roseus TaxID=2072018 RepID=A0A2V2LHW4_9RHOB|nr:glycosyl transferase family protein [Meridianimarinicoccus roseus]PWR04522.1 glycosyl transferase family protein [Meridianimarinicoccus roseus]
MTSLADHVRTLGRGPGRARSMDRHEAADAMRLMLAPGAAPEAVGALLMLLRMKGETAPEIAGLAEAARSALPTLPQADLDWPCYAAGRTRGLPLFLLSARLVAMAGHRVLLHGWNGPDGAVRAGLHAACIGIAPNAAAARARMAEGRPVYLPLETLCPPLFALLGLRSVLGLRSCINTVCRMLNPAGAAASVQGVFHPSYRLLQADAAALLGWQALSVIKGGGGEFERHPGKPAPVFGLRGGGAWETVLPPLLDMPPRRLSNGAPGAGSAAPAPEMLRALWQGCLRDPFAEAVIVGTAALALDTLGVADPRAAARDLWDDRPRCRAA